VPGAATLELMHRIDELYLKTPFYGSRKMMIWLCEQGYAVGRDQVRRLMRMLGLEAIYQKPRTSKAAAGHKIYPYLLRDLVIDRPNQIPHSPKAVPSSAGQGVQRPDVHSHGTWLHLSGCRDGLVQPPGCDVKSCE